uniref:uncharacterized protein LOC113475625 isoform X2 n=1 Tax=Ciona intestinalis TaxID=7719 RepID=UPI000EF51D01|nr:uncharacterized protein LOC113475625 isoform X2 [Ciona intestinalis]|eukprot:XP_026695800.1 uncharacterized protein LOC113475625 isoform X2 [Ciona intestinalis]
MNQNIKLYVVYLSLFHVLNTTGNFIHLPASDNKTTRALGISNLKISTTISTTGVSSCGWRYGGEFDVSGFYSGFGCSNYTGVNETITCVNNSGTVTSQLTLLQPQYKNLNINMQCSPSPTYSVNITLKQCSATNQVNVTSSKNDYNSIGNASCPSGSELFYKVNGSFVVDRTTTCNAYAEWTNINNMQCSKGPGTLFITGNYTGGVIRGNKIALHCSYSGETPPAKFSRFYFNQKTRNVSRSSTWISHPLQASDNNKVVECKAVNQYTNYFNQSHRAIITLNVTYPPQAVATHITVSRFLLRLQDIYLMRSDQILNMTCSANSNPNPVYRWKICPTATVCIQHNGNYYMGSVPLNTNSVFCQAQNFLGITKSQRVNITVVSTNRLVSIQATPNTSPENGMKLERHLGHNTTITCSVDHQGKLNTTHALKLPNGSIITKPTIELAALATTDTGNYSCVTNDVFGSFNGSVYIDVIYPPQTATPMVICDWVIGNTGFCVITFLSNPPVNMIELKNVKGEIIDQSIQTSHYNTETQVYNFTVRKVMAKDFGNHTLKVKSTKFPRSGLTITVVINGVGLAPPATTNRALLIAVTSGAFVLLVILIVIMYILYKKKQKGAAIIKRNNSVNRETVTRAAEVEPHYVPVNINLSYISNTETNTDQKPRAREPDYVNIQTDVEVTELNNGYVSLAIPVESTEAGNSSNDIQNPYEDLNTKSTKNKKAGNSRNDNQAFQSPYEDLNTKRVKNKKVGNSSNDNQAFPSPYENLNTKSDKNKKSKILKRIKQQNGSETETRGQATDLYDY